MKKWITLLTIILMSTGAWALTKPCTQPGCDDHDGDFTFNDGLTVNGEVTAETAIISGQPISIRGVRPRSQGDLVPVNAFADFNYLYTGQTKTTTVGAADTVTRSYIVDCNPYRINENTDIGKWGIWINDVSVFSSAFYFQVWRATSKDEIMDHNYATNNGTMVQIGESENVFSSLANGFNLIDTTQDIIGARIGDYIVIRFDKASSGTDALNTITMNEASCSMSYTDDATLPDVDGYDWLDATNMTDGGANMAPIVAYGTAPIYVMYGDSQTAGGTDDRTLSTFTCVNATNVCTHNAHGLDDGDRVYATGADLPDPLVANKVYYINFINANTFYFSLTRGGVNLGLNDDGTPNHTLYQTGQGNAGYSAMPAFGVCNSGLAIPSAQKGCNDNPDYTWPWQFAKLTDGLPFQNLGIGGKTIAQLADSDWLTDLVARKPRMAVLLFGANDLGSGTPSGFGTSLTTIVSNLDAAGIQTAIIKVLPSEKVTPGTPDNHDLGMKINLFNEQINTVALAYNSIVIDASTYVGTNFSSNLQVFSDSLNLDIYEPVVPSAGDNGYFYYGKKNDASTDQCWTGTGNEPSQWCLTIGCEHDFTGGAGGATCIMTNGGSQEQLWNINANLLIEAVSAHFNKEGNAKIAQAVYDKLTAERDADLLDSKINNTPFNQWGAADFTSHLGSLISKPAQTPFFHVTKANQTVNNATAKLTWDAYSTLYNRYGYASDSFDTVFDHVTNDVFESRVPGLYDFDLHVRLTGTGASAGEEFYVFLYKAEVASPVAANVCAIGGTIIGRTVHTWRAANDEITVHVPATVWLDGVDDVVYACAQNPNATANVVDGTDTDTYLIGKRIGD